MVYKIEREQLQDFVFIVYTIRDRRIEGKIILYRDELAKKWPADGILHQ
jgi:hypothetical protein